MDWKYRLFHTQILENSFDHWFFMFFFTRLNSSGFGPHPASPKFNEFGGGGRRSEGVDENRVDEYRINLSRFTHTASLIPHTLSIV